MMCFPVTHPCRFVVLLIGCVVGCAEQPQVKVVANWTTAKLGMSRAEIEGLFGKPTGKGGPATITGSTEDMSFVVAGAIGAALLGTLDEYWEYGPPDYVACETPAKTDEEWKAWFDNLPPEEQKKITDGLVGALFGGPADESFVVFFDSDGQVKELRAPIKGAYSHYRTLPRPEATPGG